MMRLALVVLLMVSATGTARADVAADAIDPCADTDARLAFVSDRLHADGHNWRTYQWAWGVGLTAAAGGGLVAGYYLDDEGERVEQWVGAGKSVLGLGPLFINALPAGHDAEWLDARLAAATTAAERCALVPEAERLLRRSAENEAWETNWLAHSLNALVNGAGFLYVGLEYDRWGLESIGGLLIGVAVGELKLYTRPSASLRGRSAYDTRWGVAPMLGSGSTGLVITAIF